MKWKNKKHLLIITCLVLLAFQITVKLVFSPTTTDNVNISSGVYLQPTTWIKPALNFDGTDNYVEVPNDSTIDFTSEDFTLEFWVYPENITGFRYLVYKGAWTVAGYMVQIYPDGQIYFGTNISGDYNITTSNLGLMTLNNWHHIVIIRSGASGKIYVNGTDETASSEYISDLASSSAYDLYLAESGATPHDGLMDEIRFYGRAITETEILYSYNSGNGYHTPYSASNLELWLKLNENSGIIAQDSSGNDNDGTIYGASWDRGKVVLGTVQNRYTLSSATSLRNVTLNSGTLRLSKDTNAYEIACSTNDDVTVNINKWFSQDITQFQPDAEIESSLSFTVNGRDKGEPQAISGVSSWSYDEDTTTVSLACTDNSLVTLRWADLGTRQLEWYLDLLPMWLGIFGLFMVAIGPVMLVYFAKQDEWNTAFVWGLMCSVIGMGLVIGWLW